MSKAVDLSGKQFGNLLAVKPTDRRSGGNIVWLCLCGCGVYTEVSTTNLKSGHTTSCGCYKRRVVSEISKLDLTGEVFGRLTCVQPTTKRNNNNVVWSCMCTCGRLVEVPSSYLTSGSTKSCGCLRKDNWRTDIKNTRFGKLTAIKSMGRRSGTSAIWECLCDCGNVTYASTNNLRMGHVKSCGCLKSEASRSDNSNKRFGRLLAIYALDKRSAGRDIFWLCLCDCGNYAEVRSRSLVAGSTQSCGCLYCKGSVYLYVFYSTLTGLIKIGISGNVHNRKKNLEEDLQDTIEILGYRLSSRLEETQVHRQLKQYQAVHPNQPKGKEWFYSVPEVLTKVNELCTV